MKVKVLTARVQYQQLPGMSFKVENRCEPTQQRKYSAPRPPVLCRCDIVNPQGMQLRLTATYFAQTAGLCYPRILVAQVPPLAVPYLHNKPLPVLNGDVASCT